MAMTSPASTASDSHGGRQNPPGINWWDGLSTYDPADGTIELGRFAGGAPARYRFHTPGRGAAMGVITGAPGQGKTGTLNVISAEAGLAMLCPQCGARGNCGGACTPQRIMAVWLGDPQMQGLSVWRGRADLLGWGPGGVAELIDIAEAASAERGRAMDSGERRGCDPRAGFPLVLLGIDELAKLAMHPDQDMAAHSMRVLADGVMTWRSRGIHLLLTTPLLTPDIFPSRELREMARFVNFIAHRADGVPSAMGGRFGDPRALPQGEKGAGYIAGPDERPDEQFCTKCMPEVLRPGMTGADIRRLATQIEQTPLEYDEGTAAVLAGRGLRPRQVLTSWQPA